jgi:excisionase family DNA binding protein
MTKLIEDKKYFSTKEVADILGISTVAVFKKIKNGTLKAEMISGGYLISKEDLMKLLNVSVTEEEKTKIAEAVKKTIEEYGEVLKMLGKE